MELDLAVSTTGLGYRRGQRDIVRDIDLQVPCGAIYGFLGHNGAGKTTTLRLLLGLLRPSGGQIRIDGRPVQGQSKIAARQVGALLDARSLYPALSGMQNLDLTRRLLGLPESEMTRVLGIVELSPTAANRRVEGYSLGMRQRLGLARALLGSPRLLILDEPCNGLDPDGIVAMRQLLRELPSKTGATVILSSHLLGEIEQIATHVGILAAGRLVIQEALSSLQARQRMMIELRTDAGDRARTLVDAMGWEHAEAPDLGMLHIYPPSGLPSANAVPLLARNLVAIDIGIAALVPHRQSLEQLYRHVSVEHAQRSIP